VNAKGPCNVSSAPPDIVTVELGDRAYPILIGSGLLAEIGPRLATLLGTGAAAIITNPTVGKLYLEMVEASLRQAGWRVTVVEIPDGEEYKNLASLALIYDRLLEAHLERASPIVALGGGVIGDLAGFAAATLLRGVPFVQLPTTLLAQVDSSVGGKTGINHPAGKNLIGAFYQPRLVLIDISTLKTLPRRELLAGLAEVIKYGVILDAELFATIEARLDHILLLDEDLLRSVVQRCCALKAMVVHRDEREADYRSILNFGHTLAHALEALTGYQRYLHGEAVAVGMAFAAKLSCVRGYCSEETMQRITQLLKRAGLTVEVPSEFSAHQLAQVIEGDKKVSSGKVKFVCIESVGRTRFEHLTAPEVAALAVA
jgi:3-dehydroquinate synthase